MNVGFILCAMSFINFIYILKCAADDFKDVASEKKPLNWLKTVTGIKNSSPYCKLCCIDITSYTIGKNCGSHTLCKYPAKKIGPACKGYIKISFTESEKQALLNAHNTIRNNVAGGWLTPQPQASNMRALEWSKELEEVAVRWAAQCIYNNDECRDLERYPVGQNIAQGNFAVVNELSFVKTWFDEYLHFNASEVNSFQLPRRYNHKAKRYTQIVWADTYHIGCARAVFQETKQSGLIYRENIICNYGPAGNIPNLPVYKIGPPCTSCPEGTTCGVQFPYLCGGMSVNKLEMEKQPESEKQDEPNKTHRLTALHFTYTLCFIILY